MTVSKQVRRGVVAGALGGALMSVSTNLEMRLRRRPPSRVPAQTLERFLPLALSERQQERLVTAGHVITSAGLGTLRGLLAMSGLSAGRADAAFAGLAFTPDFVVIPALGGTSAPWRWSRIELVVSGLHHSVYAAGTIAAYRWLAQRSGT
jgi:hypothetical protein